MAGRTSPASSTGAGIWISRSVGGLLGLEGHGARGSYHNAARRSLVLLRCEHRGVDLDPGTVGGGDGDRPHVGALGGRRLYLAHRRHRAVHRRREALSPGRRRGPGPARAGARQLDWREAPASDAVRPERVPREARPALPEREAVPEARRDRRRSPARPARPHRPVSRNRPAEAPASARPRGGFPPGRGRPGGSVGPSPARPGR